MKNDLLKKKKMLLAYALATSLSVSALTGCGNDTFIYEIEENGDLLVNGDISFNQVKKLKLIHLTNEKALIDKYILAIEDKIHRRTYLSFSYVDIETGKLVYDDDVDDFKNFKLEIVVDVMYDYMYKYDMVKDYYDIEDIKKLKEYLLLDETLNIEKEMQEKENTKEGVRVLKRSKKYC